MRCLYCQKNIPVIKRLTTGRYCSEEHKQKYISAQNQTAIEELAKREEAHKSPPAVGSLPVFLKQKSEDCSSIAGLHGMNVSVHVTFLPEPSFPNDAGCITVNYSVKRNTFDFREFIEGESEEPKHQSNGWPICQPIAIKTDGIRCEQTDIHRPPHQIIAGSSTARLFLPEKPSVSMTVKLADTVSVWPSPRYDLPEPTPSPANAFFKARVRLLKRGSAPHNFNVGWMELAKQSWQMEAAPGISQSRELPVCDLYPDHSYEMRFPELRRLNSTKIATGMSLTAMAPSPLKQNDIRAEHQAGFMEHKSHVAEKLIENRLPQVLLETSDPVGSPFIARHLNVVDRIIQPSCQPTGELKRNDIREFPQAEPVALKSQAVAVLFENKIPRHLLETNNPAKIPLTARPQSILDRIIQPSFQSAGELKRNDIREFPKAEPLAPKSQVITVLHNHKLARHLLETNSPAKIPFTARPQSILDRKIQTSCQPIEDNKHSKILLPAIACSARMTFKVMISDQLLLESVTAPISYTTASSRPDCAKSCPTSNLRRIDSIGSLGKRLAGGSRLPEPAHPMALPKVPDSYSRPAAISTSMEFKSTVTPPITTINRRIHRLSPTDILRISDVRIVLDEAISNWSYCSSFARIAMPLRLQRPAMAPSKDGVSPVISSYTGIRMADNDEIASPKRTTAQLQAHPETVIRGARPIESHPNMHMIGVLPLDKASSRKPQSRRCSIPACWTSLPKWPLSNTPPRSSFETVVSIAVGSHIPRAL